MHYTQKKKYSDFVSILSMSRCAEIHSKVNESLSRKFFTNRRSVKNERRTVTFILDQSIPW